MEIDAECLFKHLKCPLDWDLLCPSVELRPWLNYAWYRTVLDHKVDNEAFFFSQLDNWSPSTWQLADLNADERWSLSINIRTWRRAAKQSYRQRYGWLARLTVAGPEIYPKHYCAATSTDEDVAALSIKIGEGVLYPRLTVERQRQEVWSALAELWDSYGQPTCDSDDLDGPHVIAALESLFVGNRLHIAREFCAPIGSSKGKHTSYGALKYDFSSALVHICPISQEEAAQFGFQVTGWLFH